MEIYFTKLEKGLKVMTTFCKSSRFKGRQFHQVLHEAKINHANTKNTFLSFAFQHMGFLCSLTLFISRRLENPDKYFYPLSRKKVPTFRKFIASKAYT